MARCWAYETSLAINVDIPDGAFFLSHKVILFIIIEIPFNDYFEYFAPNYRLHTEGTNQPNDNSPEYLDSIVLVPSLIRMFLKKQF